MSLPHPPAARPRASCAAKAPPTAADLEPAPQSADPDAVQIRRRPPASFVRYSLDGPLSLCPNDLRDLMAREGFGHRPSLPPDSNIARSMPIIERVTHERSTASLRLEEEDARIEAVYEFNPSPTKNIGKLCTFLRRPFTPEGVAAVLHETPGLLGEKIGDFLARPDHEEYLLAYFRALDLRVNFLDAMRRGLSGPFFMPGEAQQVERTIQALSEVYMEQNPAKFGHVNDPVVLGFALVMLNTDMLKPNVTRKMTVAEFVANTSGAFEHSQFPPEELEAMYHSLKESPFAFAPKSNDFMALCAPKKRGWLKKRSQRFAGGWKSHYFVLANSSLYYFRDDSPGSKDSPLGNIQLMEVEIARDQKAATRFVVTTRGEEMQYVKLTGIPRMMQGVKAIAFEAEDEEKANEWVLRLKKSACMGMFLDGGGDDGTADDGAVN